MFLQGEASEGDVHAEGEVHVGAADGENLGCDFEELMVGTQEEVEAAGMEVHHPTKRRGEGGLTEVDGAVEPFGRLIVGGETAFRPRVGAVDALGEEEAAGEFLVERHLVFGSKMDGGGEGLAAGGSLVGDVEVDAVGEVVEHVGELLVDLVLAVVGAILAQSNVVESVEGPLRVRSLQLVVVFPAHETEVEDRTRDGETGDGSVPDGTKVEGHTDAREAELVVVDAVPVDLTHLLGTFGLMVGTVDGHLEARAGGQIGCSAGVYLPLGVGEGETHLVHLGIGVTGAEEEFELTAHLDVLVDSVRVAQRYLCHGVGLEAEVADVVGGGLTLLAQLHELEEALGDADANVGAGADGDGVEALEGLETGREDVDVHIGGDAVVVVELAEECAGVHGGAHEGGELVGAGEFVEEGVHAHVRGQAGLDVAQSGDGDIVLLAGKSGVQLVTEAVSVHEIAGA